MFQKIVKSALLIAAAIPSFVFADAPVITSFTSSASSQPSGYAMVFSWTVPGGNGQNILFACPTGVTIKNVDTNVAVPCNSSQAIGGPYEYGQAGFTIVNVSGSAKTMKVRIIPRDASGAENAAGAKEVYVTIGAVPQPITDFTATPASIADGDSITLAWTGVADITGTNIILDCMSGVKFSSSGTTLPCGVPAFATAQPASGSVLIAVSNSSSGSMQFNVRILPVVEAGVYDSTHGLSKQITVSGKALAPVPTLIAFSSSKTAIISGEPVSLYWNSVNAIGTNFIFPCKEGVTVSLLSDSATTTAKCGTIASNTAFAASGTTTIVLSSALAYPPSMPVSLLVQNPDGTYDGVRTKMVTLSFAPPAGAPPANTPPASTPPGTGTPPAGGIPVVRPFQFTAYLQKGSRGSQVSALQAYLAVEPQLYPEGLVTGYLGTATEAAIKRFQLRYGITTAGGPGYGVVGPKTRAKLNTLDVF